MDFYSGMIVGIIISAILIACYEMFKNLTNIFCLEQEAAERITEVVNNYPICLSDCADILEAVAPLCSMWTTGGFLRRFRIEFPHGTFEETFPDCPSCGNWIDGDCRFKNECTVMVDMDGFRVGTPSKHNGVIVNKTDVSLASQFCGDCHLRYNCDNITEHICLSNDFCKYIKDFRPLRKKETMELVWHNCKTCPPSEKHNENLLLWDGYTIINAEWDNGSWFCGKHYLDTVGEEEMCWWADLTQTVDGFFKKIKESDTLC